MVCVSVCYVHACNCQFDAGVISTANGVLMQLMSVLTQPWIEMHRIHTFEKEKKQEHLHSQ